MENTQTVKALEMLISQGEKTRTSTENLRKAAYKVAQSIINAVPVSVRLPRGYVVFTVKTSVGNEDFLGRGYHDYDDYEDVDEVIDGCGRYVHGDFNAWVDAPSRETLLNFAKDLKEGLLDEITEFLAAREKEDNEAIEVLEGKV